MKEFFTVPNRLSISFREAGIYVVLPFREVNKIDSIISSNDKGEWLWIYDPRDSWKIYPLDGGIEKGLSSTGFLDKLKIFYPQELDFFLWYPEALHGDWKLGDLPRGFSKTLNSGVNYGLSNS